MTEMYRKWVNWELEETVNWNSNIDIFSVCMIGTKIHYKPKIYYQIDNYDELKVTKRENVVQIFLLLHSVYPHQDSMFLLIKHLIIWMS